MDGCKLMLAALLLLLVQSCAMDTVNEPSGSKMILSLTVVASSDISTRAHYDDEEEEGIEAENYIDIDNNDLRIFLLSKSGEILQEVINLQWSKSTIGSSAIYSLTKKEIFFNDDTEEDRAKINGLLRDGVSVMVLANSKNARWDGGINSFPSSFDNLWKDGSNFNYNYVMGAARTSWQPKISNGNKDLIPMFGILHTTFDTSDGKHLASGRIQLQRAMAKVEVIDNIKIDGVSLSNVTLSDFNQVGRLIPDIQANPDWDKIGEQVGVSSLPADPAHLNTELNFIHLPAQKKWIAYVPEMSLAKPAADGSMPADRTHLNLTLAASSAYPGFNGSVYQMHFAKYVNSIEPTVPDESWNHILRNHIYRFSVNNVGVNTELELHVKPWVLDDDEEWDFSDNITIDKTLEWKSISEGEMTYEDLDKTNGRILLWIDEDKSKILTGTFSFKTPLNGEWIARLIPLDDALPNAMSFVDANGNPLQPAHGDPPVCLEISGLIEKDSPAYIRIQPTNFGNETMSAYKLEFYVKNLGTYTRVSMVNEKDKERGATFDNYIIVRKSNKLQ